MSLTDYLPAEAPTSHSPHGVRRRSPRSPCAQLGIRGAVAVAALMWAARIAASNAWRKPRKHSGNTPLPSVCIYTPRASYTFPAVGPVGGTGGQGRRRKEVSSRFIDYDFWPECRHGGDLLCTSTKQYLANPKNVFLWGVSCFYEVSTHGKLRILKCMKHRGELGGTMFIYCSNLTDTRQYQMYKIWGETG